ncbi:MAG TPA: hypothetical protein VNN22_24940 [Verrucomicrobiae bacterium]|nr:hypothetical protein [Verrucomicrobiae bacterium]
MIPRDGKKIYGDEYPAAIVHDGMRMPLLWESRFSRHYQSDDAKLVVVDCRFLDGSASITAVELERDWASWTKDLRIDFCQQCRHLFGQSDFPEMLRFVMQHGSSEHWAAIALRVADHLPQQEAFDFLVQALQQAEIGRSSNITQGISATKHPSAETVLRKQLGLIWEHPALWDDSTFLNWVASDATNCINRLIEVGVSPADFAEQAQRLSQHVCSRNRDSWNRRLSKHYPEITLQN